MFVLEDPGKGMNSQDASFRRSIVRSFAAHVGHQRRRLRQKSQLNVLREFESNTPTDSSANDSSPSSSSSSSAGSDAGELNGGSIHGSLLLIAPPTNINNGLVGDEARAVQFFRHRTALRWAGWQDAHFWNVVVLQIAADYQPVKHALVSLGAYHEFAESKDSLQTAKMQVLSLKHANRVLMRLAEDHDKLPISVILLAHIMFARVAASLNPGAYSTALKLEFALMEDIYQMWRCNSTTLRSDSSFILQYIEPIVARQASRDAQGIDPLLCLRNTQATHFITDETQINTLKIDSLIIARDTLEQILNWTTYVVKTEEYPNGVIPKQAAEYLSNWSRALNSLAKAAIFSRKDYHCMEMLRLAAKFGVMMIETMNTDDEMIFDDYTALYAELVEVLRGYLSSNAYNLKADVRFGMSPGFLVLAGNTAVRWCRQPDIRSQLISLIWSAQHREAGESIIIFAQIAAAVQQLEERGLDKPPKSCHDITASNRIIVDTIISLPSQQSQQVTVIQDPWNTRVRKELWLPYISFDKQPSLLRDGLNAIESDEERVTVMGRGYRAWLDTKTGKEWRLKDPKFFFPLPRT